jgi:hypothetical protein
VPPEMIEAVLGATVIPKSGAVTSNMTLVVWSNPSVPVPVIVIVAFPGGVFDEVVTVIVELVPGVMDAGLKLADAPVGAPLADRATWSENPKRAFKLTVYVALPPGLAEELLGEAVTVKSGPATFRVTLVECVSEPLVPVIVRVDVPIGVPAPVVIVRTELPDVLIEVGLKDGVAPDGRPVAVSATLPLNVPSAPTLTV